jgi:hypothetical protein
VYVGNDPVNKKDPYGLSSSECKYYDGVCTDTGGKCFYECYTAPTICNNPYIVPTLWGVSGEKVSCIKSCLIREDKSARINKNNLTSECCMKDSVIDSYHEKCYSECEVETWRYPGVWPLGNGN